MYRAYTKAMTVMIVSAQSGIHSQTVFRVKRGQDSQSQEDEQQEATNTYTM